MAAKVAAAPLIRTLSAAALLGAAAFASGPGRTGDTLLVDPKRVVLEGEEAAGQLTLRNTGTDPTTYRLSLVRMRMGERGEMSLVDEPREGELFADGLVRFSPVEVRLLPGAGQTVRLKARKVRELAAGEYRAHLLFRPVAEAASRGGVPEKAAEPAASARFRPLVGVTVPIIVRIGDVRARVRIANVRLEGTPEAPRVEVTLEREGLASVYGGLVVRYAGPSGRSETAGGIGGVAVYVPNARRIVEIPLRLPETAARAGGRLRVEYRGADDDSTLLAEGSTELPPPLER